MRLIAIRDLKASALGWNSYYVNPNTNSGNWIHTSNVLANSIPFSYSDSDIQGHKIFEIVLPLIKNFSEKQLLKITDRNQDKLSVFRKTIIEIAQRAVEENIPSEFVRRDVINPEVDYLQGEYKNILQTSGIKVLSNVAISLGMYLFSGTPDSSLISGILGKGSLGYGIK